LITTLKELKVTTSSQPPGDTDMTTKNNKTGRGLARAQRRLKESAKSGRLHNVTAQTDAIKRLIPAKEQPSNAAKAA
jgi:hypothetical protein